MKSTFLLLVLMIAISPSVQAQPVNYYPATTIATAGGNATVVPFGTPGYAERITANATGNFKGLLHVEKETGLIFITNAHPAGNYTITVRFFHGSSTTITTFSLTVNTYTACNKGSFGNAANVTSGTTPVSIAVGDFNNDGKQDLVTANSRNNTAFVKLGDGFGGFLQTAVVSTGSMPVSVAVSDFDGDGNQDIAVANKISNTVSVRLGDGTGGFSGTTEVPAGTSPQFVIAGNFNNDGQSDLAIANSNSNTISIRLGNGAGSFTGTTEVPVGNNPYAVATGDFNNDNSQDIVAANFTSNTASIRFGNGVGGFTGTTDLFVGIGPRSLVVADFDGNNTQDFAVLNNANDLSGSSNSVSIRYSNGAGIFTSSLSFGLGNGNMPINIAAGDFNSDGRLDLALTNVGSSNVLIQLANSNNGLYTLASAVPVITKPYSIAIGDFNQDGRQDFATSDTVGAGNISIRLSGNNEINVQGNNTTINDGDNIPDVIDHTNFENVQTSDTANYVIQDTGPANLYIRSIMLTGTDNTMFRIVNTSFPIIISSGSEAGFSVRFLPTSTGIKTTTVNIVNDDCDEGTYDFVLQGNGVASTPTLGLYSAVTIVDAGANAMVTPTAPPANVVSTTASTTSSFKGLLHINPATGIITITNAHPAGTYLVTVKAHNGFTTSSTSFSFTVKNSNCSNSRFSQSAVITTTGSQQSVVISDFNGDGNQDLASVNVSTNTASINYGNGAGGFGGTTSVQTGPSPFSIAAGDFNGDGRQDFVTANTGSSVLSVWLGSSNGGFSNAAFLVFAGTNPYAVTTGDFNSDGKLDLAIANSGNNTVSIRIGDGEGNFSGSTNVTVGTFPYAVVKGDFNGDGNLDFATANYNSTTVSIRLGDGTGAFSAASDITTGSKPISLAVGDFNTDGKQDLAVANNSGNTISVCHGNGTGSFTSITNINVETIPATVAVGDFNGDGKQDIAAGLNSNTIAIYSGDGTGTFVNAGKIITGGSSKALVVGDFNEDGRQDFASGNSGVNTISIHLGEDKEINVQGNSINIDNGNNVPDINHHTDFGYVNNGNMVTKIFTIQNTGADTLTISSINVTGADSPLFAVSGISLPTTILPGAAVALTIIFTPTGNGFKTARVNIINDDCDESMYDFAIRGTASCTPSSTNNIWLGTTADWNLASNWSLNFLPSECTKVVVNTGVPFMPEITSITSACYSLTLNNGATITVKTGGHLNITANN